jgi:ABC-type transport system involved in multi-copper enzyme maturation permease subunit
MGVSVKKGEETKEAPTTRTNADEVALELMKQLITLASGVLALSATFISGLEGKSIGLILVLLSSWVLLLVSISFGLQTISVIVKSRLKSNDDWSMGYGRKSAWISKYAFTAGIGAFAVFAFLSLQHPSKGDAKISLAGVKQVVVISSKGDTTRYTLSAQNDQ